MEGDTVWCLLGSSWDDVDFDMRWRRAADKIVLHHGLHDRSLILSAYALHLVEPLPCLTVA